MKYQMIRDVGDILEAMTIDAINDAGDNLIQYVSLHELFAGHELNPRMFQRNQQTWVAEISEFIESLPWWMELFHLNTLGHENIVKYLVNNFHDFGLATTQPSKQESIDIVFVIDTTASNSYDANKTVHALQSNITSLLNNLADETTSARVKIVQIKSTLDANSTSGRMLQEHLEPPMDFVLIKEHYTESIPEIESAFDDILWDINNRQDSDDKQDSIIPLIFWSSMKAAFNPHDVVYNPNWRDGVKKLIIYIGRNSPYYDPLDEDYATTTVRQQVIQEALDLSSVIISSVIFDSNSNSEEGQISLIEKVSSTTCGEIIRAASHNDVVNATKHILASTLAGPFAWLGNGYVGFLGMSSNISFDASGSYANIGLIETYEWDVSNNNIFASTTKPYYGYDYESEYNGLVILRVTDSVGKKALGTVFIDITFDSDYDSIPDSDDLCPEIFSPRTILTLTDYPDWIGCIDLNDNGRGDMFEIYPTSIPPSVQILTVNPKGAVNQDIPVEAAETDLNGDENIKGREWIMLNENSGCKFAHPGKLNTSIRCSNPGTYTIGIRVFDKQNLQGFDEVDVVVDKTKNPKKCCKAGTTSCILNLKKCCKGTKCVNKRKKGKALVCKCVEKKKKSKCKRINQKCSLASGNKNAVRI